MEWRWFGFQKFVWGAHGRRGGFRKLLFLRVCVPGIFCRFRASGPKSEKNRRKIDFGLTRKIGKKSPKNRKNGSKIGFRAIFFLFFPWGQNRFFGDFFPISGRRPEIGILPGTHTRKNSKFWRPLRPPRCRVSILGPKKRLRIRSF